MQPSTKITLDRARMLLEEVRDKSNNLREAMEFLMNSMAFSEEQRCVIAEFVLMVIGNRPSKPIPSYMSPKQRPLTEADKKVLEMTTKNVVHFDEMEGFIVEAILSDELRGFKRKRKPFPGAKFSPKKVKKGEPYNGNHASRKKKKPKGRKPRRKEGR